MGLWSKLTGGQSASTTPTGRSAREQVRRNAEIRRIDAGTAAWLRRGGIGPRKDR
ncbi:hypothetical protein [Streptomyces sp. LS1784]|uniref:hypothetical protein n=1 Tax=Streptomyces sp. LS1784 TaxID=2851533 RepID=UPI001CCD15F3|nr:hypothetical protein [Streptomyces sp. LS1784]